MSIKTLNVDSVCTTFNTNAQNSYNSGPNFEVRVPQSTVMVAKPLSYEFRVLEEIDADGKIAKVRLQSQVWEHNNYGTGTLMQDWTDVPRVRMNVATGNVL